MALTGFFNDGICYATLSEAMDAHYSSAQASAGGSTYVYDPVAGWSIQSPNVVGIVPAPSNIFPACDPSAAFLDGITIAYAVMGVMVTALIWKKLQSAVR